MSTLKNYLILSLLLITSLGCSTKLTPDEYIKYYETNRDKYRFSVERNGLIATVSYRPNEYYIAQDIMDNNEVKMKDEEEKYSNSLFFTLTMRTKENSRTSPLLFKDGREGYYDNVVKNTFQRNDDIYLLNGKDTVELADYQYERNWGFSNDDVFVLTFPKKKVNKNIKNYNLIIRNMAPELGTLDIPIKEIYNCKVTLKRNT